MVGIEFTPRTLWLKGRVGRMREAPICVKSKVQSPKWERYEYIVPPKSTPLLHIYLGSLYFTGHMTFQFLCLLTLYMKQSHFCFSSNFHSILFACLLLPNGSPNFLAPTVRLRPQITTSQTQAKAASQSEAEAEAEAETSNFMGPNQEYADLQADPRVQSARSLQKHHLSGILQAWVFL